jgi:hypothetical protein
MRIRRIIFSLAYSLGQITTGLLLHPYQTMQSLVKQKIFIWMSFLPTIFLSFLVIFWKFAVVPTVQLVFSCKTIHFFACDWLHLLSNTIIFFCIYWQILLLYLLIRFILVYKK